MPILKLKDADIYYEAHSSGPPFLFLSETACDGEVWKIYQVPEFSRDHTVITFDYRGMGQSSKPPTKYTMEMFADDAAAILDHLKLDQAIVCGHSMGGRVAQVLALKHPSKVKKLILASSGAGYPDQGGIPLKLCMEMVHANIPSPWVGPRTTSKNIATTWKNSSKSVGRTCRRWSASCATSLPVTNVIPEHS